jgi:hypothetical protein
MAILDKHSCNGTAGDFKLASELMHTLQACAACMQQMAHHADGKAALREVGAIAGVLDSSRSARS